MPDTKITEQRVKELIDERILERFQVGADGMPRTGLLFPVDEDTRVALKNGFVLAGTATLASGTVTVTHKDVRTTSRIVASYSDQNGTTGTNIQAEVGDGEFTITAINTSGSTVTTDTSDITYIIIL